MTITSLHSLRKYMGIHWTSRRPLGPLNLSFAPCAYAKHPSHYASFIVLQYIVLIRHTNSVTSSHVKKFATVRCVSGLVVDNAWVRSIPAVCRSCLPAAATRCAVAPCMVSASSARTIATKHCRATSGEVNTAGFRLYLVSLLGIFQFMTDGS